MMTLLCLGMTETLLTGTLKIKSDEQTIFLVVYMFVCKAVSLVTGCFCSPRLKQVIGKLLLLMFGKSFFVVTLVVMCCKASKTSASYK